MCVNLWLLAMHKRIIHRFIPFVLTFTVSVLLGSTLPWLLDKEPAPAVPLSKSGTGSAHGTGSGIAPLAPSTVRAPTAPYRVTFQPKARYTDEARQENVQGAVRLKITLLANGDVGRIVPVTELPHGLTEMAIAAARQIKFEPKMVNGKPVSVVVTREYTFTIY